MKKRSLKDMVIDGFIDCVVMMVGGLIAATCSTIAAAFSWFLVFPLNKPAMMTTFVMVALMVTWWWFKVKCWKFRDTNDRRNTKDDR